MSLGESSKGRIKFSVRAAAVAAAAGFSALFAAPHGALAANGTWTGTTDFHWEVATNWLNNVVPGSNDGAAGTSADVALFNTNGGTGTEILVDANRDIGGITFDISTVNSGRTVGQATGPTLFLSAGGTIQITAATATTTSCAISAPLTLLGNATFGDYSTNGAAGLKNNGNVSGGVAGSYTLTLDGVNLSGTLTSNCQFVGSITDGAATHPGVVKSGTGVWDPRATPSAPTTYSRDTLINGGGIRCKRAGPKPPHSNHIVNP